MIFPTIHTNGTSPERLRNGYIGAAEKIRDAESALLTMEFNARDYYPQGPNAWATARDEYASWLADLNKIRARLESIAEHCQDMIDAREAQRR